MKRNIRYFVIIILASVCFASCSDILDIESSTQTDATEMFKSEQGFKDALIGCYIKMNDATLFGQNLTMTTVELMAQHWDLNKNNFKNELYLKGLVFDTDYTEKTFSTIYGALYNVIVQANDVYAHVQSDGDVIGDEAIRSVIEAEALAIRAFCHMEILRLFGQMPQYGTTKVSLSYATRLTKEAIPAYNFEDYVNLILKDFDDAETLFKNHDPLNIHNYLEMDEGTSGVNDDFLQYRRFRFNLYAIKALKARLYLYVGNTTKAYEYAMSVINAKDSKGVPMLSLSGINDLPKNYYALPTECLLALSDFELSRKSSIHNAFDNGYYLTKAHFNELITSTGTAISINNRATTVWDGNAVNSSGTNRPILRKYLQPGTNESITSVIKASRRQVIPLIRLSEMYLIAIETTRLLSEANTLYKNYMLSHNCNITTDFTAEQFGEILMNEYQLEFFGEGQMFYTYKRKGSTSMRWRGVPLSEENYIVPLPATESKSDNNKK